VIKALFRERAAMCLRVAQGAKQPQNKAVLVRLALLWYELARREPAGDDANTARRNYLTQEEK
jgi:hypothetical protein